MMDENEKRLDVISARFGDLAKMISQKQYIITESQKVEFIKFINEFDETNSEDGVVYSQLSEEDKRLDVICAHLKRIAKMINDVQKRYILSEKQRKEVINFINGDYEFNFIDLTRNNKNTSKSTEKEEINISRSSIFRSKMKCAKQKQVEQAKYEQLQRSNKEKQEIEKNIGKEPGE